MNLVDGYLVSAHQHDLLGAADRRRLARSAETRLHPTRRPWRRRSAIA
jgi:hypothetical protein